MESKTETSAFISWTAWRYFCFVVSAQAPPSEVQPTVNAARTQAAKAYRQAILGDPSGGVAESSLVDTRRSTAIAPDVFSKSHA